MTLSAKLQGRPNYKNEAFVEEIHIGTVNNMNDKEIIETDMSRLLGVT